MVLPVAISFSVLLLLWSVKRKPKKRHIGYSIFLVCCYLSARIAPFRSKPLVATAAEARWGHVKENGDSLGMINDLRYYIWGVGIIGLLMVVEDYFTERAKKKKEANQALVPTPMSVTAPAGQEPRQP